MLISILQTIGALLFFLFMITFIVGWNMQNIPPFSNRFARENLTSKQIKGQKILIASIIILILSFGFMIIPTIF